MLAKQSLQAILVIDSSNELSRFVQEANASDLLVFQKPFSRQFGGRFIQNILEGSIVLMFRILLLFFLLVESTANANAAIIHSFDRDDDYIAFGSQLDSVVAVIGHDNSGGSFFIGSGVVAVDNHTLLLSAHQFGTTYYSYSVRTGTNLYNDVTGVYSTNNSPIIHPNWSGNIGIGSDLNAA